MTNLNDLQRRQTELFALYRAGALSVGEYRALMGVIDSRLARMEGTVRNFVSVR